MARITLAPATVQPTGIWNHAARTLTDIDGDDYTAVRAALLDNADGAVSAAGGATAAQVWAQAARALSDISAEEIFDLPILDSVYVLAAPAAGGVADTFGSWVQISADVGVGRRLLYVVIGVLNSLGGSNHGEMEFGEGGAGSEAAVTRAQFLGVQTDHQQIVVPLWRALTDNARLSVRARDSEAATNTYRVKVHLA